MMKHLLASATLFAIALPTALSAASNDTHCATLLSQPTTLEQINDTIRDLATLRFNLDIAKVRGDSSLAFTRLNADYEQKEKALVAYLEANKIMSRDDLMNRVRQEIVAIQSGVQIARDEESRHRKDQEEQMASIIDGTRLIMHRIEPGDFMMGHVGKQVPVTLTKPFYMAAIPTTQIVWREIAELANSRFSNKYEIRLDPSNFNGDTHPVENVSYDDVYIWIKGLNDLSQIGEPLLIQLIPGHKKGDVYRLPTDAEWEFVVRGRGLYNDFYYFGNDKFLLDDYAWYSNNSRKQSHPVAQKKPLIIDGKEFYDMHGNVSEWVHNWYGELSGGRDPQGPKKSSCRAFRSGAWYSLANELLSTQCAGASPGVRDRGRGFRLAREAR